MVERRKQNISDEERERRRQRMIALRKKLQEREATVAESKTVKNEIIKPERPVPKRNYNKKVVPVESETSDSSTESEEEVIVERPPRSKPISIPKSNKKVPVVKKVSIKYYSDVTQEQMDKDKSFISNMEGLTKTKPKKASRKPEKIEEEPVEEEVKQEPPKKEELKKEEPPKPSDPHKELLKSLGYSI